MLVVTLDSRWFRKFSFANASSGIASASLETGIPVSFGLLTTDTIEQAIERSGTKAGNQGRDATVCAIEMARLLKQLSEA